MAKRMGGNVKEARGEKSQTEIDLRPRDEDEDDTEDDNNDNDDDDVAVGKQDGGEKSIN